GPSRGPGGVRPEGDRRLALARPWALTPPARRLCDRSSAGERGDGGGLVRHEGEERGQAAGVEDPQRVRADLAQLEAPARRLEAALQRDQLGEEDAIQALRLFRAKAEDELAAGVAGQQLIQVVAQLVQGGLVQR